MVLKDIAMKLRVTNGDPFLIRSLIGDHCKRDQQSHHPCDLNSDDETEFFEVLVSTKSSYVSVCNHQHPLHSSHHDSQSARSRHNNGRDTPIAITRYESIDVKAR